MKKYLSILGIFILIFVLINPALIAHPGRTDKYGCHTCKTNCEKWGLKYGEYHCHNGSSSSSSSGTTKSDTKATTNNTTENKSNNSNTTYEKAIPIKKGELNIFFLNVEQGDATFIYTPKGNTILIDGAKKEKGETIVKYLNDLGIKSLDVVVATHPDADHIGGLIQVIKKMDVKAVYAPKVSHTSDTYKDFLQAVKDKGLKIKTAKSDVLLDLEGIEAKFVGPVKEYDSKDLNDWSAVLHLKYKETSFLFTGDAESKSENDMINGKQTLEANVLKVGHHGAKTSTSKTFLNAVNPQYAVISVGKNDYGHPTDEVLKALKDAKVTVYRTDENGTVVATSDGKKITFKVTKEKK